MTGQPDLIFDMGFHTGEDTSFYLKKGFRVVAVEADPNLCENAVVKFADNIRAGRLTLVQKALAREPGRVTFYRNCDDSVWGTIDPTWVERNTRLGTRSEPITVDAITMPELLNRFGIPYYLKIDIEGLDMVAVEGLATVAARPSYLSLESSKESLAALRREVRVLTELGYDRFKAVNQNRVPKQVPPNPPREGTFVRHRFEPGASGLFGEEAPGKWMTADEVVEFCKPVCLRYALTGDDPLIRSRPLRQMLRWMGFRAHWYDIHAKLGGRSRNDSAHHQRIT